MEKVYAFLEAKAVKHLTKRKALKATEKARKRTILSELWSWVDAFLFAIVAVLLINQFLFQLFMANYGFEPIAGSTTSVIVVESYDDIHDIIAYPFTDEYVEWAHKMKDWAGRGYWSSNALSSTMDPWSSIQVGTSAVTQAGVEEIRRLLKGKTTAVAGPSGAGKSSLTNLLAPHVQMETGEISKKLGRGRHTTRHSQLIPLEEDTYLMDTPGFTSFYVEDMEKEELRYYFPEFAPYEGTCRFQGCTHTHEPGCKVKEAWQEGKIHARRYENYLEIYKELEEKRRY